jgi:hypothetical protein
MAYAPALVQKDNYMSIKELEHAVSQLSCDEMAAFSHWFDEFRAEQWDRQIESDILSGRLDAIGKRADADFESGRCTPL